MADEVQLKAWVSPRAKAALERWVIKEHGHKRGNLSDAVENAILEYVDKDRYARIEANQRKLLDRFDELDGSHTHKHSETVEKVEQIHDRLGETGRTVIPDDTVRRAIEDVAGADDRTIEKYSEQLKRRELAYEHPSAECGMNTNAVWTLDREQWVKWAGGLIVNNPSVDKFDLIGPYPDIGVDEFVDAAAAADVVLPGGGTS